MVIAASSNLKRSHSDKSHESRSPGDVKRPRRRLMRGRRQRSPSPISEPEESSGADSDPELPELKSFTSKRVRQNRNAKHSEAIVLSSDEDELAGNDSDFELKKKNATEIQGIGDDSDHVFTVDDSSDSELAAALPGKMLSEQQSVLHYLNSCAVEELSRMTGMSSESTAMVEARPFKSLKAAKRVQPEKTKLKAGRETVGEKVVSKLEEWFRAFQAVTTIIDDCEKRGVKLNSVMSSWNMQKNGIMKPDGERLVDLPIMAQPAMMDADVVQLKTYQLFGLNWMNMLHSHRYSAILADDMGLGKTCQVISFICQLVGTYNEDTDERPPWPNMIVVPPSTIDNWEKEFQRFAPDISILIYRGNNRQYIDIEEAQDCHVVLTTYSQIDRRPDDLEWIKNLQPYAAVYDEGHKLKNMQTGLYARLMKVPCQWRLVLSGTPIQNNLKELLSLLTFVEPDLFLKHMEDLSVMFETKVANKDVHNFAPLARERVAHARKIIAPFILQRNKSDVLDLPGKIERVEHVGMQNEQKAIYTELKGNYLAPKNKKRGAAKAKDGAGNPWMQLRKAGIHHQLFRRWFDDAKLRKMTDILWKNYSEEELNIQSKEDRHKDLLYKNLAILSDFQLHLWCKDFPKTKHLDIPHRSWEESPKVQKLLELVRGYQKSGDRCLVFSRFEMVISILRETLWAADIPYCELTGALSTDERGPEIKKFKEDPSIPVFLLTTGAGGTGLNLTEANKIILFDQSDNPQDDVQASNRAHRIGQTRDVEVIRLITKGTVEELVYNSCVKKLMLADVVNGQYDDENDESIEEECRRRMMEIEAEVSASQANVLSLD